MNLNPAYLLATSLRAASVTHLGQTIRIQWQAGSRCAVRVTPNAEGDVQFPGPGHRAFVLGMTYSGSEPLTLRTRLRGSGWLPAHTELWADHDLVPGEVKLSLDTREFRLCQNGGPSDVLELEWSAKDAGELWLRSFACVPLSPEEAFAPLVDRYGQRIHGEWPEKIHSDEDLVRDSSQALLAAVPGRDQYGGWEAGAKSEATGYFCSEQREDGWWLITPEGSPFLSFGACCVTPGSIRTNTRGREHFYEELPPHAGKFQEAWQGARPGKITEAELFTRNSYGGDSDSTIVNFAIANLIRKWGKDWFTRWSQQSVGRLRHWGMNTLGCWSDLELCQSANMPYCLMADRVCPAPFEDLVSGDAADCFPLRTIPDVCHPEFERKAEGWFDGLKSFVSDRYLLGYFVGNEELWCLWQSPFALPLSWESRRSFLRELENKYPTIESLNRVWETGFASFKDLGHFHQNQNPPGISPEGEADCDAFMRRFTDRYFSTVRRELQRADPNHQFWGCRFLALPPRECILKGAAPYMDVVSINWYLWHKQCPTDAADFLRDWHERCGGKPLVISEYSFTATDERLLACHRFHRDQAARARIAADVTECCQRLPFVVGMHWFQYIDQPITGRTLSDGERGNFGLVDVADRPHAELTAALNAAGDRLYAPRIDYSTHPHFNPPAALTSQYEATIERMGRTFGKELTDKKTLLSEALLELETFTPRRCREEFGLGSGYSLAKEYFYETIAANAACVARVLVEEGDVARAKAFLTALYQDAFRAGYSRDSEFLANRLDSRTFMPMRRHIDAAYLRGIGMTRPRKLLLCIGDCQTVIQAEKVRDAMRLPGLEIASYQHEPGSLIDSPLNGLLRPAAFFTFSKLAADYALLGKKTEARETYLQMARDLVAWLHTRQPKVCVFVTHVFFGVENAVEKLGIHREVCMDAVSGFSDEVAAILAGAPNARLINFQEICAFTPDTSVFRDPPSADYMLHFRFDIMDAVSRRIVAALHPLENAR